MSSMIIDKPLERLDIFRGRGVQMRTFHITWLTFFVCFFGWFGIAPLMPTIREDLGLTKAQVGNTIIAAVASTIIARLIIGRICDIWGPRKTYTVLLVIGAIPVMCVGFADSYSTFLMFRLATGVIGASFVVTQFHTSMMFAPNVRGTANAFTGGWGNLGGGITNMVMPLIFATIVAFGFTKAEAWRYAMVIPGVMLLIMAFVYYRYTKDTPAGNFDEIGRTLLKTKSDWSILKDCRVWSLALAYFASFGVEIMFDNVAALHFTDTFKLPQTTAGFLAGVFGAMNIFARALGGILADKVGNKYGLRGKGVMLAALLVFEGFGIMLFAQAANLGFAIITMLSFALFLKMANGTTYAIVPFISQRSIGLVSGIVGAGGNLGGMLFGFLFKSESIPSAHAFTYISLTVMAVGALVLVTRFQKLNVMEAENAETKMAAA